MTTVTQNELAPDMQVNPDGEARLVLRDHLDGQNVGLCWTVLERNLRGASIKTLIVDASGLQ